MRRRSNPYSSELAYLRDYLLNGIDAYDFAHSLGDFFDSREWNGDVPDDFDPQDPYLWLEEDQNKKHLVKFKKWLERTGADRESDRDPANAPTYMHVTFKKILPRTTWLVHFTNDIWRIINKGLFGFEDMTRLGLTTWWKKSDANFIKNGWNFAFEADGRHARVAAHGDRGDGKYGRDFAIFQAAGVLVQHHGDQEDQVIFRGGDVRKYVPVERIDGGFKVINVKKAFRPYYTADRGERLRDNFDSVVAWVIQNAERYGMHA